MSNPFGGIGAICVSKKPRTLHADVPTFPLLMLMWKILSSRRIFMIIPRSEGVASERRDALRTNSRGFLNPWNQIVLLLCRLKDGEREQR